MILRSVLNATEAYDVNSSVPLSPEELGVLEEDEPTAAHRRRLQVAGAASPIAASTPFRAESLGNELSRCLVRHRVTRVSLIVFK